ncbi:MAG: ATP-binding protein [Hyphomicrobiaceae bacterium]|nr:ATP-binding protein [Hyphomicrobiaceae bacterium]
MKLLIWPLVKSGLFRKYAALIGAVIGALLLGSGLFDLWFTANDHRDALAKIQREQANAAAARISQFFREIEAQLGWMTHLSWDVGAAEQRELDTLRLLRQVPAISELRLLDGQGRERLRVSRQAMDRIATLADLSADPRFRVAVADKIYYGPVTFRRGTEPVMSLSVAGTRREAGVVIAQVNLTHIWDVIHTIRVGTQGLAYVVGPEGRLLAHPDLSLVLRNTDMSQLSQVRTVQATGSRQQELPAQVATNVQGRSVLTTSAVVEPLKWIVFVELPVDEADAPLYASMARSILLTLAGIGIAFLAALVLAHRMVVPIRTLSAGAARIGAGALDHRIMIDTQDELQALGAQFNDMAARMQVSYATLEGKVEERTRELQAANLSKSRFLAAASHDLRQPLHALNLLVANLRSEPDPARRARLASRIELAVSNMNELFGALLDISKLDAGALSPAICDLPLVRLFERVAAMFGPAARERGLHFSVVETGAWIRSDPILLERILLNLVSNAVRYTSEGGIVIGCRRKSGMIRIDVCDTGIGVPSDQQKTIFAEFYRGITHSPSGEGLGLGLAIVDRLSRMLSHPIEVVSMPGRGSRFSILVPAAAPGAILPARTDADLASHLDSLAGRTITVIDDDELVLRSTRGLLESWGCRVVAATSLAKALETLNGSAPDFVVCDYRLREGTGVEAINALRQRFGAAIPGFVISGDVAPTLYAQVREHGLHLLHKPLAPAALRATIERALTADTG